MINRIMGRLKRRDGQAMVETLIVIPPLVLILLCTMYLGNAYSYKVRVAGAARYVALKQARQENIGDLHHKFFHDGPPLNYWYRSDPWTKYAAWLWLSLVMIVDPLFHGDYPHLFPWIYAIIALPEDAYYGHASAVIQPPPGLSWVGTHSVSADCGIDANSWRKPYWFDVWGIKHLYWLHWLVFYGHFINFGGDTLWWGVPFSYILLLL